MSNVDFMKLVQDHEREWGTSGYSGRPDLAGILSAPVVVFWRPIPKDKQEAKLVDARMHITLHDNLQAIEKHLAQMLIRSGLQMPDKKIAYIFHDKEPYTIESIQINFARMKTGQGG